MAFREFWELGIWGVGAFGADQQTGIDLNRKKPPLLSLFWGKLAAQIQRKNSEILI
jgi:hypothetical protein